jgi:hypothetical protein
MSFFVCGVCVCACVYVLVCMLVCLERVVKQNVRRTEYHTRGRMWNMCVIFGTPSEKWYARTKNGTLVPKTVRKAIKSATHIGWYLRRFIGRVYRIQYQEPYLACVPKMALRTKNGFTYQIQYACRKRTLCQIQYTRTKYSTAYH